MGDTFIGLGGRTHRYCDEVYNAARTNERAVEVPIALDWIRGRAGLGLEVGNVLHHYAPDGRWGCIDRDERAVGVTNLDILDFHPTERYDWIVSLSTVEHIGWDDVPRDPDKALAAVAHLRGLLAPAGRLLLSFPSGHHPGLDDAVAAGVLAPADSVFMVRTDAPAERCNGEWEPQAFRPVPYLHAAWSAGAVWVGEFEAA